MYPFAYVNVPIYLGDLMLYTLACSVVCSVLIIVKFACLLYYFDQ